MRPKFSKLIKLKNQATEASTNEKQAEKAIRLATIAPIAFTTEHAPSDTASKKLDAWLQISLN